MMRWESLSQKAEVPGFRVGKVPTALLEKRFKKEITADIKQKVLMASLEQLSDESKIEPINEPRIDVESLDIPESGDFHYEFEVEVRPEFDLPDYTGISDQSFCQLNRQQKSWKTTKSCFLNLTLNV